MNGLIDLLNGQRLSGVPELDKHIGWDQKGPLAKDGGNSDGDSQDGSATPDSSDTAQTDSSLAQSNDHDDGSANSTSVGASNDESTETAQSGSRHLQKFVQCGAKCFHHALKYYRRDFDLLGYPQTSADL